MIRIRFDEDVVEALERELDNQVIPEYYT